MTLARVLGNVVSTVKHPAWNGYKLLIVEPVDEKGKPAGKEFLAIDRISEAGEGDLVLVNREGNGNRQILAMPQGPIRSVISPGCPLDKRSPRR